MSARIPLALAVGAACVLAPASALACGVCIEDKVAATYDHAVVTRAAAQRHVVVFAALDGVGAAPDLARDARAAAARMPGVDRGSVRSAAEPPALSFALDPGVRTPEAAASAIERAARTPGLKVTVLKVLR